MSKSDLKLKRLAVTAWRREHKNKNPGPPTSNNRLPSLLDVWMQEINGTVFVAVQFFPPRSAPDEPVFYEIVTAPKVVKAKQAIKVTQPPLELVAEVRRRDESSLFPR